MHGAVTENPGPLLPGLEPVELLSANPGGLVPTIFLLQCHIFLFECLCGVLASHPSSQMPLSFLLLLDTSSKQRPPTLCNTKPHNLLLWKALLDVSSSVVLNEVPNLPFVKYCQDAHAVFCYPSLSQLCICIPPGNS